MRDYLVCVKIKNNRILSRIEEMGVKSVIAFCRDKGIDRGSLDNFVNFRLSAVNRDGQWTMAARRLASAIGCRPEELWTERQRVTIVASNQKKFELTREELGCITAKKVRNVVGSIVHGLGNSLGDMGAGKVIQLA